MYATPSELTLKVLGTGNTLDPVLTMRGIQTTALLLPLLLLVAACSAALANPASIADFRGCG